MASTGGPVAACETIALCQTALDAALPDPAAAADRKSRKVAKRIGKLDRKADKQLAKAGSATGRKQAKRYRQARRALEKLLSQARAAANTGRLGMALEPLEAAVNALLARIPAP